MADHVFTIQRLIEHALATDVFHVTTNVSIDTRYNARNDHHRLHMSDVVGCPRAIAYRRRGERETIKPRSVFAMQRGISLEAVARTAIAQAFDGAFEGNLRVWHAGSTLGEARVWYLPSMSMGGIVTHGERLPDDPSIAIGHLDLLIEFEADGERVAAVIEIKSLPFLTGDAPQARYASQAVAYTLPITALGDLEDVFVFVVEISAVTGESRVHHVPLDIAGEMHHRLSYRAAVTAPGDTPLPEGEVPPEYFAERGRGKDKRLVNLLCESYCGYTQCVLNATRDAETTAE